MSTGYLALVLHAHLPFVRHPEHEDFLEEDWFYEAISETYLPLLRVFHRLRDDGVPYRLTLSLTPTLCAMLRDPLLQRRYVRYLDRAIGLARAELERTRHEPALNDLARFYLERFLTCRNLFVDTWKGELIPVFRQLQDEGFLEIITCAATHGFLPLMEQYPEAVRAQIFAGCDDYRECFGRDPVGIWLPECAYVAGIDEVLQEANLRWFVIDSHGLMFGQPRPRYAIYAPCFTPSGPAAFARDRDSSRQVWSSEEGYPGDPAYRDFYRDIGFDLSAEYLAPFSPKDGPRKFTGLKYHRVTGRGVPSKDLYNRGWAEAAIDSHASHFMRSRAEQIGKLRGQMNVDPIVMSPFDAELFGHWWFEGPEFLDLVIRKSVYDQDAFQLTTPAQYLEKHPTAQLVAPSASSWGHKGYWEVWLDDSNSWIYPHLHAAARRMIETAGRYADLDQNSTDPKNQRTERALRQLARELLLAQSSDWAFLMKTGTAREYANSRTKSHILRFTRLYDQLRGENVDPDFLAQLEEKDNLFPTLQWRHYLPKTDR